METRLRERLYDHLRAPEKHGRPLILVIPDGVMIIPITGAGDIPLAQRRN